LSFSGFYDYEELNSRSHSLLTNASSAFIESEIYTGNKFVFRPGIRYDHSSVISSGKFSPRISIAFKATSSSQFSAAAGFFCQLPANNYLYESAQLDYEKAGHLLLNYQFHKAGRTYRMEAYYKSYSELIKMDEATYNNTGYGYARGLDVFYRDNKTIKYADFWITYSFIHTKRNYRDFPVSATPSFVAENVVNLVGKYFISKISTSLGATYTFASGRHYHNPNSEKFLNKRTRDYHNFSMNLSYLTHIADQFTIIYLSVENVFGIKNIYGYRYSPDGQSRKPILPAATRSIFLGVFITFGDKDPLQTGI
jgi:hypothetical protein